MHIPTGTDFPLLTRIRIIYTRILFFRTHIIKSICRSKKNECIEYLSTIQTVDGSLDRSVLCPLVSIFIYLYIHMYVASYLSLRLSVCLPIRLSVCLSLLTLPGAA